MKRFVLILRKVAKFVFRLISSRLSSRGAAGTISKLLETKFVSKLLENAVNLQAAAARLRSRQSGQNLMQRICWEYLVFFNAP